MQNDNRSELYRKLEAVVEARYPGRIAKFVAGPRLIVIHKSVFTPELTQDDSQALIALLQVATRYDIAVLIGDCTEVLTLRRNRDTSAEE